MVYISKCVLAIDRIGPMPDSASENKYVLVVEDYFTKWVEAFPVPDKEALAVADKLVTEVFCRFGCPRQLHFDRGREFDNTILQEVCRMMRIDKTLTTPYHPQSDGLV